MELEVLENLCRFLAWLYGGCFGLASLAVLLAGVHELTKPCSGEQEHMRYNRTDDDILPCRTLGDSIPVHQRLDSVPPLRRGFPDRGLG
jgi:hypothetical protein